MEKAVFNTAIATKNRFLSKNNFKVKLNLSYIVLVFVEEGRLQTEINCEAV